VVDASLALSTHGMIIDVVAKLSRQFDEAGGLSLDLFCATICVITGFIFEVGRRSESEYVHVLKFCLFQETVTT
jgi:hypothetical protein